jgi:hypothetical protein
MKNVALFAALFVGLMLVLPVSAYAADSGTGITNNGVGMKVTFVNQDPISAEPGGYVNLLFKVENWGTANADNVVVELLPQYPFSLDYGLSTVQQLGTISGLSFSDRSYLVKYRVRVDKDAIDGENEIKLKYSYGNTAFSMESSQTFNVTVENPKTDFDVVVQDSASGTTSLAIANVGSNTAYSVIVSIPDQAGYKVSGASSALLGNLDASDYTLASFQIAQVSAQTQAGYGSGNFTAPSAAPLKISVAYTDTLGIRRTVEKEVSLAAFSAGGLNVTSAKARFSATGSNTSLFSGGLLYIVIGVVGIVAVVAFFKLRGRKKKETKA